MKRTLLLITLLFIARHLAGQGPIGSWADHLPYHSVKYVAAGKSEIFGATDFAITVYNKKYDQLRKLSKVHGLTDCGISAISYSDKHDLFIIAYQSTNIDIYKDGVIINIPDLFNKYIAGKKKINRIRTKNNLAYLATSFGIVLVDLVKNEIYDTWNPSPDGITGEVLDVILSGDIVYAATVNGLFCGDLNGPALAYYGNWTPVDEFYPNVIYNSLSFIDGRLFVVRPSLNNEGDSLLMFHQNTVTPVFHQNSTRIYSLEEGNNQLIVSTGNAIMLFDPEGNHVNSITDYEWATPNSHNAVTDGSDIYIADIDNGLVKGAGMVSFKGFTHPGPYHNNCYNIYAENGSIYIAGGLVDNSWNNTWLNFRSFFFEDRKWWSGIFYDTWDPMRIRPYPGDPSRIFISTWGSGLYEISNHQIVNNWDETNSPLETIIPGANYVRICGLAFDDDKNLWLTQSEMESTIKVLTPDGNWILLPYTVDAPTVGDIIITRSGYKWVVLPRGNGLFILDDNDTPDIFTDDRTKRVSVKDQDGKPISNIYAIVEDLDGSIWIGTDQGPAIFYNPENVFEDDFIAYRIKISRDDGSGLADYLLGTEIITSIAVDGGNRKWLGTNSSGAYLVSPDGKEQIQNYNASNSPVLSDIISGIAVDEITGEVWIGTSKGLVTVRESATSGTESMANVYAFPNPVRESFEGPVTISGLSRNTNIKITDVGGNLVFETTSTGGQATWDLTTYNGKRVSTGVYLIFCSNEDGSDTTITKLLIIR